MATKKSGHGGSAGKRKRAGKRAKADAAGTSETRSPEAAPPVLHSAPGTPRAVRTVADLEAGDHLCCLYETEEEHRAVLTPYLRQGLERGEKVVYIVDAHTAKTVLGYLRDDGLDPEPYVVRGQLSILSRDETYLRGGAFDPEGMIALLRAETARALAEGYAALRVTGEMTWALRGLPGSERLIEYEVLLNEFFPGSRCLAVCQYDRRRFEPAVLLDVLRVHPYVVIGPDVCDNAHFVPPAEFYSAERPAAELRRWMQGLKERERAEEALRESEARYRELFDNISSGVAIYEVTNNGNDFIFKDFNRAGERLDGDRKEDVIGKSIYQVRPGISEYGLLEVFKRVWATGIPEHYPAKLYQDERLQGWYDNFVYRLPSGEIVAVYDDITERKRAEEALRESENRYRLLVENASEAILVARDGRLEFVNPMAVELSGFSEQELLSRPFVEFIHPDDRGLVMERHLRRLTGDASQPRYTFRLVAPDGRIRWVEIGAVLIDWEGKPATLNFLTDITERRRAEEELQKLASVVRYSSELVNLATLDGKMIFLNEAGSRMLGISPAEVEQFDIMQVIPAHLKEKVETELLPALMGVGTWAGELQYLNLKTGQLTDVHAMTFVVRDLATGAPLYLANVSRDITEGKRAEEALKQSEIKYRTLIDVTGTGYLILDSQGRVLDANQEYVRLSGHTKLHDILGKSVIAWTAEGAKQRNAEAIAQCAKNGFIRDFVTEYVDGGGKITPIEINASVDGEGESLRIVSLCRDITDRKRADEALAQERFLLQALMNNVPDHVYFKDRDSRLIRISKALAQAFGVSDPAQSVGKTDFDFFTEEHARQAYEDEQAIMRTGQPVSKEERETWADRPDTWVSTTKAPLRDEEGNVVGTFGISRDITERKRAEAGQAETEARNRQLQKAESLSRMAGAIAHHFNNQLQAVLLNLELAKGELLQDAGAARSVTDAMMAANQAAEMSKLMLTYLGQTPGVRESLDLSIACGRWLSLLEVALPKHVVLKADLASPGPTIRADAGQMRQVLTHLVTNAWEAGGAGRGEIRVTVKAVTSAAVPLAHRVPPDWQPLDPAFACLEVVDHGCGVAETDIEKIFDPFYSSKFTGRGLGLAVVLGIVRAHGGAVTVDSTPGSGSAFRVYLPVSEAGAAPSRDS